MDKHYDPQGEDKIYQLWLQRKAFTPKIDKKKKPFTILLPLPNANDPMHIGHAMFTIQDILCRYHRMIGDPVLWLPGADHAGIETQFVFEKRLQEKGQSRFDYDRLTLYQMIWDYVEKNRKLNQFQLKELGFSLDWTRYHYSLEPAIIKQILATFKKLHQDKLLYRAQRIVNYCTHCGTAFSNLEVNYVEQKTNLYYMKYGPFVLATTRPETKFGDTAVAVHPKDKRYQKWIGKIITIDGLIGPFQVKVIADDMVDPEFGTGVVKITPAHDPNDFEAGLRHNLSIKQVIGLDGRLNKLTGKYAGLTVQQARKKIVADLKTKGDLVKVDSNYIHRIGHCYRCNHIIEPLPVPQWYVKTKPLAKPVISSIKKEDTLVFPKRFKKVYLDWMENIRDWNISRQIVWGPQIPAWYCLDCHPDIQISFINSSKKNIKGKYQDLLTNYQFQDIKKGLQTLSAPIKSDYFIDPDQKTCPKCQGSHILQETDTFDTWFLSGQWPLTTLGFDVTNPKKSSPDFTYFYPTSVMDTLSDILFFWVGRMMIFGFYLTGKTPFKLIHLHAKVIDQKGQKISKSKGNVINPTDIKRKYGADALRLALVYGIAPASNIALSDKKIESMRNFVNKIWNAARFTLFTLDRIKEDNPNFKLSSKLPKKLHFDDEKILKKLNSIITSTTKNINKYRFGQASEDLYHFFWHQFCDLYIEQTKNRGQQAIPILFTVLIDSLKLLHPFIPFVTESIYQQIPKEFTQTHSLLTTAPWPCLHEI